MRAVHETGGTPQLFALGVAQLLPAQQVVGALVVAGDAGEHLAHHPLPSIRRAKSCSGAWGQVGTGG